MKGRSLKNIIFSHAIISLILLAFSIFIILYNVAITIIYDLNNSKYDNEVQMTAKYLDLFFDDTAESFLRIIRSDIPLDRKPAEISRNKAVFRAGFSDRYYPVKPD